MVNLSPISPTKSLPPGGQRATELVGRLALQCVGLSDTAMTTLNGALDNIRGMLGTRIVLRARHGDVALVDGQWAADLSAADWCTLFGRRPVVAVVDRRLPARNLPTQYRISTDFRESELLDTLNAINSARERVASSAAMAPLCVPEGASPFVATLLARYHDRDAPPLAARFGGEGALEIDFLNRQVMAEPAAWAQLVVHGALPQLQDGSEPAIPLAHSAKRRELDALVWAVGMACASLPMIGAPADWRSTRLAGRGWPHVYRFTRTPVHLHLADVLQLAPTTPLALMRATRIREDDLRGFLQACLLLGFGHWDAA